MTFVFPVLLGGLFLAGVPILLHLIMRQKPKTLSFPAFRFLVQRQRTNLRKLRLRHLLLLALRILLIVLVCLALGRPRLSQQGLNLSSERPVAVVLVFDTSLSMEYQTSDKLSRLAEAKKRGQEFVNELPEGSRVVILDTGDSAVPGRGDWLTAMSQARKRITDLKPRPASVSVLQTLENAYRVLGALARDKEDEASRYLPRFVCVFSDRTRACWDLSKRNATENAADQVPPSLEGLRQARGNITPLISLLKDLRGNLPPTPTRDYPEQALIDALEQLAPLLPTLTKADFPPDEKLSAVAENIQRRGRDLLDLLQPTELKEGKDEPGAFRSKLVNNLQGVLRDVSGAQGLFVDVGVREPIDLAITHLELPALANGQPRQVFRPDEKIVLQASVQAVGKHLDTTLTCKLDNKKIDQQQAEVKAGERQTVRFEIDCERLKLRPGPHQVEVRFDSPDLLLFNNRRFLTFAIRTPRRVLVLAEDLAKARNFIDALEANEFAVDAAPPIKLPTIDPRPYQAVYLFEVPAPGDQLWDLLRVGFVQQGIGLGIVPGGTETNRNAYNGETAQKLMPCQLGNIINHSKDDDQNPGALWDLEEDNLFQHPFMRPFRDWQEYDLVKNPRGVFTFWEVQSAPREREIVRYKEQKKRPALLERRHSLDKGKAGKVLLFTTLLDAQAPRWNNYLQNSMYVGLVWLATNYLAGEAEAPKFNFVSGRDEPVVALPPAARYPSYTLVKGTDLVEQVAAPENPGELKLRQAEDPGNYLLLVNDGGGDTPVAAFSVNVPAEESDLTRVPSGEIERLMGPGCVIPVDRKANIREVLQGHWSEPLELFPMLMIILLLILAVENLLANKFYRRDISLDEEKSKS